MALPALDPDSAWTGPQAPPAGESRMGTRVSSVNLFSSFPILYRACFSKGHPDLIGHPVPQVVLTVILV